MTIRLILASASPARRRILTQAGLPPEVIVSGVDEESIARRQPPGQTPAELAAVLAEAKTSDVAGRVPGSGELLVIGADSVLEVPGVPELAGRALGKPADREQARHRWELMRGHPGLLHTAHHLLLRRDRQWYSAHGVATTEVRFAPDVTDEEIEAYLATSEPLAVAGGFTLDGLSAPFISGITGDPGNVIGLSLPLCRTLLRDLGVTWPELWAAAARNG